MVLPKTFTKKMFIHILPWNEDRIELFGTDMSDCGYPLLGEVEVTVDVPQVDVLAKKLIALEEKKATIVSEYENKLAQIEDEIQTLRCLPQEVA